MMQKDVRVKLCRKVIAVNDASDVISDRLVREMHLAKSPRELSELFLKGLRERLKCVTYVELVTDGVQKGAYAVTRFLTADGRELVPDCSPFTVSGCSARVERGGVFGRIVAGKQLPSVGPMMWMGADEPFLAELASQKRMLVMPIYTARDPEWVVLLSEEETAFEHLQVEELLVRANLIGAMLTSMRTAERLEEAQLKLRGEVERIAQIQRSLLPAAAPVTKNLEVAFSVKTSDVAGGDFVDFRDIGQGDLGIIIADASGHGPSAAVVAAMVSVMIRAYSPGTRSPVVEGTPGAVPGRVAEVLAFANGHLCEKRIEESFVTAFVATWDSDRRVMEYSRAGHPPPILVKAATGEVREIVDSAGLPLGIFPDASYSSGSLHLDVGDLIVAYTDGIAEAANSTGEQFGEERIGKAVQGVASAQEAVERVCAAVDEFTDGLPAGDDRTVLALRVVG